MVDFFFEYIHGSLTKCKVKMAGCWSSSLFACLWAEQKSSITTILAKKARLINNNNNNNYNNNGLFTVFQQKRGSYKALMFIIWHKTPRNDLCTCLFLRTKNEASYMQKSIVRAPLT